MIDLCTVCGLEIQVGDYPCISTPRPHERGINGAIGDECDIWQENGFRHPQHFTHKSALRRALAANGHEMAVRHVPIPGTDRSPHTSDWSRGSVDLVAAAALVSRNGAAKGKDPEPESVPVTWQVREVNSKGPLTEWRDCAAPK